MLIIKFFFYQYLLSCFIYYSVNLNFLKVIQIFFYRYFIFIFKDLKEKFQINLQLNIFNKIILLELSNICCL